MRHKGISCFDAALIGIVYRGFGFFGRKKEVDMVECLRTGKESNEVTLIGLVSEENRSWEKGASLSVNTLEMVHLYVVILFFLLLICFFIILVSDGKIAILRYGTKKREDIVFLFLLTPCNFFCYF